MSVRRSINKLLQKFEKNYATHNLIEVSRSALVANLELFKTHSQMSVIPVLKSNAYGHGTQIVAEALKGQDVPYIAVDGYFEALRVREVSTQPVLIMGAILPENYKKLTYDRFAFVVDSEAAIRELGKTGKRINVHLEINTGMNRYGAKPGELPELVQLIKKYRNLRLEGIMSHLADSDGDNPKTVSDAVGLYDQCVETILSMGAKPTLFHIAQTAGSLRAHSKYANVFRLGIGLYGINPFAPEHEYYSKLHNLRPALTLTSTLSKVTELDKGDKVSYNYTYTAPKNMKIGVIPLGYYEGLNRALSNQGRVKIGDTYCPIVGRICMNHTMIDLKDSGTQVGDRVVVYSSNPSDKNTVDGIAQEFNLFDYNLLTLLSSDVRRVLVQ